MGQGSDHRRSVAPDSVPGDVPGFFFLVYLNLMRKFFGVLFFFGVFLSAGAFFLPTAQAVSLPLDGWGWSNVGRLGGASMGVGWISLSSETKDAGAGVPYGVSFDDVTGRIGGYAWSGTECEAGDPRVARGEPCGYGWLSFNSVDTDRCPLGRCWAKINLATGEVSGWAKFIHASGGWDGWVNLRGTAADGRGYGVCFGNTDPGTDEAAGERCDGRIDLDTTNYFSGWAWGGDIVGWIKFLGTGDILLAPVFTRVEAIKTPDGFSDPDPVTGKPQVLIEWKNGQDYIEIAISRRRVSGTPETGFSPVITIPAGDVRLARGAPTERRYVDATVEPNTNYEYRFAYAGTVGGRTARGDELLTVRVPPFGPVRACSATISLTPERAFVKLGDTQTIDAAVVFADSCSLAERSGAAYAWSAAGASGAARGAITDLGVTDGGFRRVRYAAPAAGAVPFTDTVTLSVAYAGKSAEKTADLQVDDTAISSPIARCVFVGDRPTVEVSWRHDLAGTQTYLMRSPDDRAYSDVGPAFASAGTYVDSGGIVIDQRYYYKLRVMVGATAKFSPPGSVFCPIKPSEAPTIEDVHPIAGLNGTTKYHGLLVSWQDMVPGAGHTFELQRLKVTPEIPQNLRFVNRLLPASGIAWENATQFGPFQQWVERDSAGGFVGEIAELSEGITDPRHNDPSNTRFDYAYTGSLIGALRSGMTYYYRVKTCSAIDGLKERHDLPLDALRSDNNKSIPIQCRYSAPVSVTTPPPAPGGITARADSSSQITISWVNVPTATNFVVNSVDTGRTVCALSQNQIAVDKTETKCVDSGLRSDAIYNYEIKACKDDVEGRAPVCSWPAAASETTHFVVNVSSGAGGSVVLSAGGAETCRGVSCTKEFRAGTSVTLSAVPDSGYRFAGWSGDCAGTGTCSRSHNTTASALFERTTVTFTVTIDGGVGAAGTVSGAGLTCTKDAATTVMSCSGSTMPGEKEFSLSLSGGSTVSPGAWGGCKHGTSMICVADILGPGVSIRVTINPPEVSTIIGPRAFFANLFEAVSRLGSRISFAAGRQASALFIRIGELGAVTPAPRAVAPSRSVRDISVPDFGEAIGRWLGGGGEALSALFSPRIGYAAFDYTPFFRTTVGSFGAPTYDDGRSRSLDRDSVYAYRVRVSHDGRVSDWSAIAAGKTYREELRDPLPPAPTAAIWAVPLSLRPGESTLVSWSTGNADKIEIIETTAAGSTRSAIGPSGSRTLRPAAGVVYTIIATDTVTNRMAQASVQVGVAGTPPPPPPPRAEVCGNGIDDNGNGEVDEGCVLPPCTKTTLPVCTRNSYCDHVYTAVSCPSAPAQGQCNVNDDCRTVGGFGRGVQER